MQKNRTGLLEKVRNQLLILILFTTRTQAWVTRQFRLYSSLPTAGTFLHCGVSTASSTAVHILENGWSCTQAGRRGSELFSEGKPPKWTKRCGNSETDSKPLCFYSNVLVAHLSL